MKNSTLLLMRNCIYCLMVALFSSCAGVEKYSTGNGMSAGGNSGRDDHIIAVDGDSYYYYDHLCHSGSSDETNKEESASLQSKLNKLETRLYQSDKREILLYVHGGLVNDKAGVREAQRKFEVMAADNEGKIIFPVFFVWNSGLFSSYGRHLFYEKSGVVYQSDGFPKVLRMAKGLLVDLPTDAATGIARAPVNTVEGMTKFFQNWNFAYEKAPELFPTRLTYNHTLAELHREEPKTIFAPGGFILDRNDSRTAFTVSQDSSVKEHLGATLLNTAFSPAKASFSPFYSGVGTPSWENMTRRSRTLVYRSPTIPDVNDPPRDLRSADGVFAKVVDRIAVWKKTRGYKVTVVGHSMGTMVLNEAFRGINERRVSDPQVDRIIYMAAACSIRDFKDSARLYFRSRPECDFYNLCLNPFREVVEAKPHRNVPLLLSGSLLIWIDEFFQAPRDFLDRTFGSFENSVISHRHLPQTKRFRLKAFGEQKAAPKGVNAGPQQHGEFDNYRFWKKDFLEPCHPKAETDYQKL